MDARAKESLMTLRCDMCGKKLKGARYQIEVLLRPGHFLTVGPDCYRSEKKAKKELSPEKIAAMRLQFESRTK